MEALVGFEGSILLFIQNNLRNPVLTPVLQAITSLGDHGIFWIVLTVLLLCFKKTRHIGFCSAIALILSVLINNVALKNLVARTRPYELIDGLKLITTKPDDFSFPSGHSGASFASAVAIYRVWKKRWTIWLIVLAALIALSRLYVGVHFPTDVLCGTIIGIACGFAGAYLGMRLWERIKAKWKGLTA